MDDSDTRDDAVKVDPAVQTAAGKQRPILHLQLATPILRRQSHIARFYPLTVVTDMPSLLQILRPRLLCWNAPLHYSMPDSPSEPFDPSPSSANALPRTSLPTSYSPRFPR
jgi:hypothetical protein